MRRVPLLATAFILAITAHALTNPPAVPSPAPAGKTTPIVGRSVKGRITPPKELQGVKYSRDDVASVIMPVPLPTITLPDNILRLTAPQRLDWYNQWEKTEPGQRHVAVRTAMRANRSIESPLGKDGTFQFAEVRPGKNFVEVHYFVLNDKGARDDNKQFVAAYEFTAPPFDGTDRSVIDLGTLTARPLETINAGQVAPNVVYQTLAGTDAQLSDFKGKVILLEFWGAWCSSCMQELPDVKALHAKFGTHPNFTMVSLSDGDERADWEKTVRQEKMTWPQGILGSHEDAWQAKLYATSRYPTYWLIGPDSRVLASGSEIKNLLPYIEAALKKSN